jgi:NADP-dependent 3-hydroxy acid dehydrogenase YdfG
MSVFHPNSHALITGGASGIGLAVATHCLASSMRVTIVDNNQATLDLAAQTLKGEVTCVKADVSDVTAWRALKEKVGEVDFLMLNAGRMVRGSWGDEGYFKQVCIHPIPAHLSSFHFVRLFLPSMEKRGLIGEAI